MNANKTNIININMITNMNIDMNIDLNINTNINRNAKMKKITLNVKMKKAQIVKTLRSGNDDDIVGAVADCKQYADDAVYNSDKGYFSPETTFRVQSTLHWKSHVTTITKLSP